MGWSKQKIVAEGAPSRIANHAHPFSQGWRVGDLVFTGGIAAEDPLTGAIVSGGIEAQTRRVLESMKAILAAAGARMQDVVKVTVFLADYADKAAFDRVYREYWPVDAPGRMSGQVAFIGPGILIEMDAIAVVDAGSALPTRAAGGPAD